MPQARREEIDLEELVICVYSALDDALLEAGVSCQDGKLIPRRGPCPEVDDREVLCLVVVQELLGFESDHAFYLWFENNQVMCELFPRRLSRPNWADRRALLTPLMERLSSAFCTLAGEGDPPFSSRTLIRSMSAGQSVRARRNASPVWPVAAIARRSGVGFTEFVST